MSGGARILYPLRLLFGFREPVSRLAFVVAGGAALALSLGLDEWWHAHRSLGAPLLARLLAFPHGYGIGPVALRVPAHWILFSLAARRAMDARRGPAWAFLLLIPVVAWLLLVWLAVLPTRAISPHIPSRPPDYRDAGAPSVPSMRVVAPPPAMRVHMLQAGFVGLSTFIAWIAAPSGPSPLTAATCVGAVVGGLAYIGSRVSSAVHGERTEGPMGIGCAIIGLVGVVFCVVYWALGAVFFVVGYVVCWIWLPLAAFTDRLTARERLHPERREEGA